MYNGTSTLENSLVISLKVKHGPLSYKSIHTKMFIDALSEIKLKIETELNIH